MSVPSSIVGFALSAAQYAAEENELAELPQLKSALGALAGINEGINEGQEALEQNESPWLASAAMVVGIVAAAALTPAAVTLALPAITATLGVIIGSTLSEGAVAAVGAIVTGLADYGISKIAAYAAKEGIEGLEPLMNEVDENMSIYSNPNSSTPISVVPLDQVNWDNGTTSSTTNNLVDGSGNITGSYVTTYGTLGGQTVLNKNFYSGADGAGSPNGSSIQTYNSATNVYTVTYYSGQNGAGSVTETDTENADGTSQITTYDGTGNSLTSHYSGPNGTGTSGGTTITLTDSQGDSVTMSVSAITFNLGATRVGTRTGASADLYLVSGNNTSGGGVFGSLGDGPAWPAPFSVEWPDYRIFNSPPPTSTTVQSGYPSNSFGVAEDTSQSGQFSAVLPLIASTTFTDTVDGQQETFTPTETVNLSVSGSVYAPAVAQVSQNGTVLSDQPDTIYAHVGDNVTEQFTLTNTATGALTDVLNETPGSYTSGFIVSALPQGIAAGSSGSFTVGVNTSQAGNFGFSSGVVNFVSHDSQQSDTYAASNLDGTGSLVVTAVVTNYADPTVQFGGGNCTLSGSGTSYILDFGNIALGSASPNAYLQLTNAYQYDEDGLSGTIAASGSSAFTNSGLSAFSELYAGESDSAPSITISTAKAGSFSETLTFTPTDIDDGSGVSTPLAPITITVIGSVVPTASFGGTTNKTYVLKGGTTSTTGVSGDTNIADFTNGNATPNGLWGITESAAGTIVVAGAAAGYNGTATLKNVQELDLNGTTYTLADTTVSGEALTVTSAGSAVAIDGPGNDTLNFDNYGTTYWHAGLGNTTALMQVGTTEIYFTGAESQYAINWSGTADTLTITDSVANRNNTKVLHLAGGSGDIVFADGSTIGFGQTSNGDGVDYLGSGGASVSASSSQVIYAGSGAGQIQETSGGTVFGQGASTDVSLTCTDQTPDGNWTVSENANGQVLIGGSNAGYTGTATLNNVGEVVLDGINYNLVTTPVAGGSTIVGTGSALVVDGAANDAITFDNDGTSYWHAGGGDDTATLDNGMTEIYLAGPQSQYTVTYDENDTVTVVDSVAGRNSTKTVIMNGGHGELVFSDGSSIGLDQTNDTTDPVVYGGNDSTTLNPGVNETIQTGAGSDTVYAASGDTILAGSGLTTVSLASVSGIPDQTCTFSQNAAGEIIFSDPGEGISSPITLSNVSRIALYNSYSTYFGLTAVSAGGISTNITNGGVVVDTTGNDTIHFDSTQDTYWYASGGGDTILLDSGQTEIYLAGSESQYTITYDGVNTVTVTDTISGRSGIKTIHIFGGDAELIFASGPSVALGNSIYQQDAIGYGGFGSAYFSASPGNDNYTGSSDSIGNVVSLATGSSIPNQAWQISENAFGAVVVNGTAAGFAGTVTLSNIETIEFAGISYNLFVTPVAGGTLTVAPNTQYQTNALVAEGAGNDNLTLEYQDAYWHVSGANDTASLASGTSYLYVLGTESQYGFVSGATLSVIDSIANRNGTLKVTLAGGQGQIVFSDGKIIWLGLTTFGLTGGTTSSTGTGTTGNIANFVATDTTPDQTWTIVEVAAGRVTITGLSGSGYMGTATLTDIQQISMGAAIYDLITTKVTGGATTISTPTDQSSGTVIVDGAKNDALTFSSADTSYWHVGAGNNTAKLTSGLTEIELNGASSQFSETYNGKGVVTVKNTATNATETLTLAGGTAELVFTSGNTIGLGGGGANKDTVQYGGSIAGGTLSGTTGADTIYTGVGSTVNGDGGSDNYWFGSGDKSVHVNNGVSASNTAAGQVDLLGTLTDENLWLLKSGNNLVMDIVGSKDQLTLNNYYAKSDAYAQVSQFDAASLKLDTQLATLVQAMATYSANNHGFNPQTATAMPNDTNLQNAIAAAWHS